VVVITETDGMDQASGTSRESDKITQLEARTRAYGARKRIYMECTVSTEQGRTWREYTQGTRSRIVLLCPCCQEWGSPEREQFTGWQGAATQADARTTGAFSCPTCGQMWSDTDREHANHNARLLHEGQTITREGEIQGDLPRTETLGFRWSAVNNLFLTSGDFAADEWRASRSTDEENAERELRQFVWSIPTAPTKWSEVTLECNELAGRIGDYPRGVVPEESLCITAAVDLGKYLAHWIVVAWHPEASGHVVDYGRIEVASDDLGVEQAILVVLREFRSMALEGWPAQTPGGKAMFPSQVWIDAGYMTPVVHTFCRDSGERFRPAIGRGAAQQHRQWYNRPTHTGAIVKHLGEGYHINLLPSDGLLVVEVDADYWKTWVHQRLTTPVNKPGAMSFFKASPQEHLALAKHLTAETKTEEFVAGKGVVVKWERLRRQNHWFDALYNACAAAHLCGVRLVGQCPQPQRQAAATNRLTMPDGRPYLVTER